jgi:rfaE bifunctional protein nucleotidyltransferase chain/domain
MTQLDQVRTKIYSPNELASKLQKWRANKETIVFTNGCFDLIHLGHIDYLTKAKDLGSRLVVGLNTDNSVRNIKGPNRPVKDQDSRANVLAAMQFIDAVIFFDEATPETLISWVMPDVLVKGGDYTIKGIIGHKEVLSRGGLVKTIPFLEGYSSTTIIDKILEK